MSSKGFGFLGGGQMATSIARGAIASGQVAECDLTFVETNLTQIQKLRELFPKSVQLDQASELFARCERIVLAVKPQTLTSIALSLKPLVKPSHLLVSIAAGISLNKLVEWFGTSRFIRVMPNTPCQCQQGASGIARAPGATDADLLWCEGIFSSVGKIVRVTDEQIHAVTGVSGSGPAYVLMMIEALSDGGVMAGLSRDVSLALAVQTVLGTATMVQHTGLHPALLREQVTSPGGTTIAALNSLERDGFRAAVMNAVMAAVKRSQELGADQ